MRLKTTLFLAVLFTAPLVVPSHALAPATHAAADPAQMRMPWDQPPPEFKEVERKGFHAGVQAAIDDYNHHREADPESRKEFRKPHVERSFVGDFRKGFRRGYEDAMQHMERSNGRHS